MMSVHKFGQKPIQWYKSRRQPRTIYWIPKMGVKHPPRKIQPDTWEFSIKIDLSLDRKKIKP